VIYGGLSAETFSATTLYVDGSQITKPYKVYTALLTQTGTSTPTAIVLENTLGGDIVWSRNDAGDYLGTLNGAFPDENGFFAFNNLLSLQNSVGVYWNNADSFTVNTFFWNGFFPVVYSPQDDILFNYALEIRVYDLP
jgi:hypothetical protein